MREVKLGGGFLSFNSTTLHFGIGRFSHIDKIKILWNDQTSTNIEKKIPANHRYEITRSK